MNQNTFLADFAGLMTLVMGVLSLLMIVIWCLCGVVMPWKIRREAAIVASQEKKMYLLRGINDFQNISRRARKLAVLCGVFLCLCIFTYLKWRS